jgi:hypothetical protein
MDLWASGERSARFPTITPVAGVLRWWSLRCHRHLTDP